MLAQEYPVTVACEVLDVTRSSYYYRPTESPDEAKLIEEGSIRDRQPTSVRGMIPVGGRLFCLCG